MYLILQVCKPDNQFITIDTADVRLSATKPPIFMVLSTKDNRCQRGKS